MSQPADQGLLCGRYRRRPPGLGSEAPPALRPFDALLPVVDEQSGREAWLLPLPADLIGSEVERSYFMMGATQAVALPFQRAIAPAFVDRQEQWYWIGYWAQDLKDHALSEKDKVEGAIVDWSLDLAKNLEEIHSLGKQHGLLQPGVVVRNPQGMLRLWGAGWSDLLNKGKLAQRAKNSVADHDVFFVPSILNAAPMTIEQELHGWALTCAARWFNCSGARAVSLLYKAQDNSSWAQELLRLLQQCHEGSEQHGIRGVQDLLTRLEVIRERKEPPGAIRRPTLQDLGSLDGPMPRVESLQVHLDQVQREGHRGQTAANSRPITQSGVEMMSAGPGCLAERKHSASKGAAKKEATGRRGKGRVWGWAAGLLLLLSAGGGAAWWFTQSKDSSAKLFAGAEEGADPSAPTAAPPAAALLEDAPCPPYSASLPGGVCMDQFEYPGQGERPRVSLTKNQAELLCRARKGRLCTAAEWRSACVMGKFKRSACQLRATRKERSELRVSAKSDCSHGDRFFDLIGNAAEWVADGHAMGGDARSLRRRASCDKRVSAKQAESVGFWVGFRCCYGEPPATPQALPVEGLEP